MSDTTSLTYLDIRKLLGAYILESLNRSAELGQVDPTEVWHLRRRILGCPKACAQVMNKLGLAYPKREDIVHG